MEKIVRQDSRSGYIPCSLLPRLLLLAIGLPSMVVTTGCFGPIHQWEAQTQSIVPAPSSILLTERVAILPPLTASAQVGFRQALSSAFDRAMQAASPETRLVSSREVVNLLNAKGLAADYRTLAAAYAQDGILEQPTLEQVGSVIGARYVFQLSLSSFAQEMEDRFVLFGWRIVQTRTSVLSLALQLWDTRTGAIIWSSTGETTMASDVLREIRIPFDLAAETLCEAMLLDLRHNRTKSTYTHLDQFFQDYMPKSIDQNSVPVAGGS